MFCECCVYMVEYLACSVLFVRDEKQSSHQFCISYNFSLNALQSAENKVSVLTEVKNQERNIFLFNV